MSTTFSALAFNITYLRERGILKRMRGTPLPTAPTSAGSQERRHEHLDPDRDHLARGQRFFGVDWPRTGRAAVFVSPASSASPRSASRSARDPNFESAPAYVNAIFLPVIFISGVFYDADNAPMFLDRIAQALPLKHLIDGLSGAMVTARALPTTRGAAACSAVAAGRGPSWRSAASAGKPAGASRGLPRRRAPRSRPAPQPVPGRPEREADPRRGGTAPRTIARCGGLPQPGAQRRARRALRAAAPGDRLGGAAAGPAGGARAGRRSVEPGALVGEVAAARPCRARGRPRRGRGRRGRGAARGRGGRARR